MTATGLHRWHVHNLWWSYRKCCLYCISAVMAASSPEVLSILHQCHEGSLLPWSAVYIASVPRRQPPPLKCCLYCISATKAASSPEVLSILHQCHDGSLLPWSAVYIASVPWWQPPPLKCSLYCISATKAASSPEVLSILHQCHDGNLFPWCRSMSLLYSCGIVLRGSIFRNTNLEPCQVKIAP